MEAVGTNGRISILGDNLVISRKGVGLLTTLNLGLQGDKTIPIRAVTAIELTKPGMTRGYFRLSINGRDPVGGVLEAVKDENCVLFDSKSLLEFEKFRDVLQARIDKSGASQPTSSIADELEKLASLRSRGILTDEEFAAEKAKILRTG